MVHDEDFDRHLPTDPKAGDHKGAHLPAMRETSGEFETVKRRVFTLHDGLFRRLAEHDRQR